MFTVYYVNASKLVVKSPSADAGDEGSISGLGRSPGEGNGNPLQYSCLGNFMDKGAWQATVNGVKKKKIRNDLATKQHIIIMITT